MITSSLYVGSAGMCRITYRECSPLLFSACEMQGDMNNRQTDTVFPVKTCTK